MSGATKLLLWSVNEEDRIKFFTRFFDEINTILNDKFDHKLMMIDHNQNESLFTIDQISKDIDGCYCYKRKNKITDQNVPNPPYFVHYLIVSSDEAYIKTCLRDDSGYFFFIVDAKDINGESTKIGRNPTSNEEEIDFDYYRNIELEKLVEHLMDIDNDSASKIKKEDAIDDEYLTKVNSFLGTIRRTMDDIVRQKLMWHFYLIIINSPIKDNNIDSRLLSEIFNSKIQASFEQLEFFFTDINIFSITQEQMTGIETRVSDLFRKTFSEIESDHFRNYKPKNIFEKLFS